MSIVYEAAMGFFKKADADASKVQCLQ